MIASECLNCGAELVGRRVDTLYCNEGCSKAFRRAREAEAGNKHWVRGYWRRNPRKTGQRAA